MMIAASKPNPSHHRKWISIKLATIKTSKSAQQPATASSSIVGGGVGRGLVLVCVIMEIYTNK